MELKEQEIKYTLFQIAKRAGVNDSPISQTPFENSPVKIFYGPEDQLNSDDIIEKAIVIHAINQGAFIDLLKTPKNNLEWVSSSKLLPPGSSISISKNIPILFPSGKFSQAKKIVHINNHIVNINFDIVAATFFMLSRFEEYDLKLKDKFQRFRVIDSVAYKQGFLLQPIVDEYAMLVRAWIKFLVPEWRPKIREGKILLTHDIDHIRTLPNARKIIRSVIKESQSGGLINAIKKAKEEKSKESRDLSKSKYYQAINKLCDFSEKTNLKSRFFFQASPASFFDSGYDINHPSLNEIFKRIKDQNNLIGLHPSFYTYKSAKKIKKEKESLENAINMRVSECRQHYLRFKVPDTWNKQIEAGLEADNSLSHAEHVGFRCGTCHPYNPFDINSQETLHIIERSLIVMDSSLRDYMNLSIKEARSLILKLAVLCKNVEGDFTILWHNTSFFDNWYDWGLMFESTIEKISQ